MILGSSTAAADAPSPAVGPYLERAQRVARCASQAQRTLEEINTLSVRATGSELQALVTRAAQAEATMLRCVDDIAAERVEPSDWSDSSDSSDSSGLSSASAPRDGERRRDADVGAPSGIAVVARNVPVGQGGIAESIERVDGTGVVDDASVREAFVGASARIDACYQAFASRGGARRATAELSFTLADGGRVSSVAVEGDSARDAVFRACLENAGRSIRSAVSPRGGVATFAAALRFGG